MKRLTRIQKYSAVLGAGLLIAAASGSALAMRMAEERGLQRVEVQPTTRLATFASPLPAPSEQPQPDMEHEVEFTGTVEAMASDGWVVSGRTVMITAATEIKPGLDIGTLAQVQAVQQADGTLWAREIEPAVEDNDNGNVNSNDNSNDDQGSVNSNEDHGNSNDDHEGNVNSNDDHGNSNENGNVNSDEDHGNSNDDRDGNVNSNVDRDNSNEQGNVNSNEDHSNSNEHHGDSNDHEGNSSVNSSGDHGD